MTSTLLMPTVRHVHNPNLFHFLNHFHVLEHNVRLEGYQLYAVENWIVQRDRPVITLAVYTGDLSHNITVTALSPSPALSPQDAQAEWEIVLHHLRKDGARPMQTPHGVIMTTSLANFRSDFTIVPIPNGQFLTVQQQLYANINLLRMGCSGRSALSLDGASDTTKDRFLSMYHLPDPSTIPGFKSHTKSTSLDPSKMKHSSLDLSKPSAPSPIAPSNTTHAKTLFNASVVELIKLIQTALAIFGMFPVAYPEPRKQLEADGLLCDVTVEGIQRWVVEIGESCIGIEPTERIADPMVVSALLSLVLATRNKLAAIGNAHLVPKDPFLHPHEFCAALANYSQSIPTATHHTSPFLYPPFLSHHSFTHARIPMPVSPTSSSSSASTRVGTNLVILTRALVDTIASAYEKAHHSESRRVHRVLLNKLDDLRVGTGSDGEVDDRSGRHSVGGRDASGQLLSGIGSLTSGLGLGISGSGGGPGNVLEVIVDLGAFARAVVGRGDKEEVGELERKRKGKGTHADSGKVKDRVGGCVRGLWIGRVADVIRMRERERERSSMDARQIKQESAKAATRADKSRLALSDGDVEDAQERERAEGKSTEDESEPVGAFGGIGIGRPWSGRVQRKLWAGLSRKKLSTDLSAPRLGGSSSNNASPTVGEKGRDTAEEEDLLSSGQVSPVEIRVNRVGSRSLSPEDYPPNFNVASEYGRRLSALNQSRPFGKGAYQNRVCSWADPISARDMVGGEDDDEAGQRIVRNPSPSPSGSGSGSGSDMRRGPRRLARSSLGGSSTLAVEEGLAAVSEIEADLQYRSRRSMLTHGAARRRSFHDLASWRRMRVLTPEQMYIDVELCGQVLVMSRREQYLEYMVPCLQALTTSLCDTNTSLRQDYQSYQQFCLDVEAHTKVIAQIEAQRLKEEKMTQETNTLLYESNQFHMSDLWQTATSPRHKVFALRENVFGTGGRRLPSGVHGAHERFNRLQWTLDGKKRLVDWMGRTESEAEDEDTVGIEQVIVPSEEDEEDVVDHPGIKPMWLLRFFHTWGVRWGSTKPEDDKTKAGEKSLMTVDS